MAYVGHCNCNSVRITLHEQPASLVVCHWYGSAPKTIIYQGLLTIIANKAITVEGLVVVRPILLLRIFF